MNRRCLRHEPHPVDQLPDLEPIRHLGEIEGEGREDGLDPRRRDPIICRHGKQHRRLTDRDVSQRRLQASSPRWHRSAGEGVLRWEFIALRCHDGPALGTSPRKKRRLQAGFAQRPSFGDKSGLGHGARVQNTQGRAGARPRSEEAMRYLGIDVHSKASVWCLLDAQGEPIEQGSTETTMPALRALVARLGKDDQLRAPRGPRPHRRSSRPEDRARAATEVMHPRAAPSCCSRSRGRSPSSTAALGS